MYQDLYANGARYRMHRAQAMPVVNLHGNANGLWSPIASSRSLRYT